MGLHLLSNSNFIFPHPFTADKDGFLALGGDLSIDRLIQAYRCGIFPWYNESTPILWFSTSPRLVLYPNHLKISKSMRSFLKKNNYRISFDHDFESVITACAMHKREGQDGTWITADMQSAYIKLHELGFAHSVEIWDGDNLVGGLYGIALGKIFYGESMFALESNTSKLAFISLVRMLESKGFNLVDCQQDTPHLRSFGAELISKEEFFRALKLNMFNSDNQYKWTAWAEEYQALLQK